MMTDDAVHDAEACCLGAAFLGGVVAFYRADLRAEDFGDVRTRIVWEAMEPLARAGKAIDPILVEGELARAGRLDAIGGLSYLSDVVQAVPTADNVEHYAAIVRRAAHLRRLVAGLSMVIERARASDGDPSEVEGEAYRVIAAARRSQSAGARTMADLVEDALRDMIATSDGDGQRRVLPTGLEQLDWVLGGGLDIGATHIVVARPSDGKTALMGDMAEAMVRAGYPVLFITLEDVDKALARRRIAARAPANLQALRLGDARGVDIRRVEAAVQELRKSMIQFRVEDARGADMARLSVLMRQWKAQLDPEDRGMAVVLDYVQRVRLRRFGQDSPDVAVADVVRAFDDTCASLRMCGVLGWQLNREAMRAGVTRPMMHHLGSTTVGEQVAKTILAPWHERDGDRIVSSAIWVLKQKEGPPNIAVDVMFDAVSATFRPALEPWQKRRGDA